MKEYYAVIRQKDHLAHYGVLGMRWGVHRNRKSSGQVLFVSGSSKTQDKSSPFYQRKLPKNIRKELRRSMKNRDTVIVGDAPGIDRQTQDYLKKKRYKDVEVFSPGTAPRYKANKKWKSVMVNDTKHAPGSKEWLAKKDVAMTNRATKGLAVTIKDGASATRANVKRLADQYKPSTVYELQPKEKKKKRIQVIV